MSCADAADLGFVIPEVVIPVVAMFAGVYALGAAIIGYYRTGVGRIERVGFGVAALLLSVPGMLLLPAETAVGLVGVEATLFTITMDVAVRAVGGVLLVVLVVQNRRRAGREATADADATPSAA
jgi:TRAP-type uncharacterized transport system fused permease subunit